MVLRKLPSFLALLTICALLGSAPLQDAPVQDKDEEGFVSLFNGRDLAGFKTFLQGKRGVENAENVDTFTIQDGVIQITGQPHGYLYTEKSYKNYVIRFDWKWLKGNAEEITTLVHITGDHKIWPKCVEIMGAKTRYGALAGLGSKGRFKNVRDAGQGVKVEDWNNVEIISQDGELTTKLNGVQVGTGKAELTEGPIGWMSGSARYQVKNIRIKTGD